MTAHDPQPPEPEASTAAAAARTAGFARVGDDLRGLVLQVQRYVTVVSHRLGVPSRDVHAIGVVQQSDHAGQPVTAGRLGRILGLSPAATSALLDRMETLDHVTRERSATDARQVRLRLTQTARDHSSRMFDPMTDRLHDLLAGYSDAELALIHRFLTDTSQAIEEAAGELEHE